MEEAKLTLKIIMLGSSEVGKTSILERYFKNEFRENQFSSIGIDFQTKFFKFDSNKIKVNYIDTAGQEKFRAISVNYLKSAHGVVLVFDITKEKTFSSLEEWIRNLKDNNQLNMEKVLIGNKSDLEEEREVKKEDAEDFAKSIGCNYYEGSAKSGININEPLDEIAKITYLSRKDRIREESEASISMVLTKPKHKSTEKKKKCC